MTDTFLETLTYEGSTGAFIRLRFEGPASRRRWFWRAPAGRWRGPFCRFYRREVLPEELAGHTSEGSEVYQEMGQTMVYDDMGKADALYDACRVLGVSPQEMDWKPTQKKVFAKRYP